MTPSTLRSVPMSDGAARLERVFRESPRPLFIPYLMAGYPSLDATVRHARALAPYADIIELGIPFSDPLADGPTIQAAGQAALDAGTTPEQVIAVAGELRDGPPIVLMTYLNTVLVNGPRVFLERAAAAGVAGIIIPDLPIDESDDILDAATKAGVALVPLAAPTTSDDRLVAIGRRAHGFVYLVALTGVTGGGISVDDTLLGFLARARKAIDAPLAVGFGVRTPKDAAAVGAHADGVIIGSQVMRVIDEAGEGAETALGEYGREVVAGLGGH